MTVAIKVPVPTCDWPEALQTRASILRNYNPAGYGTVIDGVEVEDGKWFVVGTRSASCE